MTDKIGGMMLEMMVPGQPSLSITTDYFKLDAYKDDASNFRGATVRTSLGGIKLPSDIGHVGITMTVQVSKLCI